MKGKITAVEPQGERMAATVQIEGARFPAFERGEKGELRATTSDQIVIFYWPELLEQWGAAKLQKWVIQQAVDQWAGLEAADAARRDAGAAHAAVIGEGEAEPQAPEPEQPASKRATIKRKNGKTR
jgi:hypothetical protein